MLYCFISEFEYVKKTLNEKNVNTLRFRPFQNPEKTKAIVIDKCAANLQIKL